MLVCGSYRWNKFASPPLMSIQVPFSSTEAPRRYKLAGSLNRCLDKAFPSYSLSPVQLPVCLCPAQPVQPRPDCQK